jgi:hypothetical protein
LNGSQQLWAARQRAISDTGVAIWREESWPNAHVPVVLWIPDAAFPSCLGCLWVRRGQGKRALSEAAAAAVAHCEGYGKPTVPVNRVPIYGRDAATEEHVPGWAAMPAASAQSTNHVREQQSHE